MNFYIPALKKWGYTGLHLSVVLFIHLSFCLSVLFCSLHKAIYITSATAGVKSDFLTVLVFFENGPLSSRARFIVSNYSSALTFLPELRGKNNLSVSKHKTMIRASYL